MTINRWWLVPLLLMVAFGCSTDDYPTSHNDGADTVLTNPSFAMDIQEIVNRRGCDRAPCHGVSTSAGLDLRPDSAYANLVGVPSTQSVLLRVAAGSVDSSYLIVKLEGMNTTGGQMPLGEQPLNAIDLQNIKNWISQGAPNN